MGEPTTEPDARSTALRELSLELVTYAVVSVVATPVGSLPTVTDLPGTAVTSRALRCVPAVLEDAAGGATFGGSPSAMPSVAALAADASPPHIAIADRTDSSTLSRIRHPIC